MVYLSTNFFFFFFTGHKEIRLQGLAKFVSCTLPHTSLSRHFCFLFSAVPTSFEMTLCTPLLLIEIFFLSTFTVLLLEILHAYKQPMSKKT